MNEKIYDGVLKNYFREHRDELIRDVKALVDIDSQRTESADGMPFGEGAASCLKKAEKIIRNYGFSVKNYDNYVVTADLGPINRKLDILAHLDVVPAGNGWTVTQPFCMVEKEGKIYGRGTADDKGPAMCALYAMRAIKELGIPLKYGVRLILGSDEECGSKDLEHYYGIEEAAPMSFSPDADFPLINIEKGGLHSGFYTEIEPAYALPRIVKMHGGTKINMVPDLAECWIEGMSDEVVYAGISEIKSSCGVRFVLENREGLLHITAKGRAAHASTPEEGENAVTALLALTAQLPLSDTPLHSMIKAVSRMFPYGEHYGRALGVDMEDERSGKTTVSFNMISLDEKSFSGAFDCRASIIANDENTTAVIYKKFADAGLAAKDVRMYEPHIVDEDSEIVRKLLAAYEHVTGKAGKPIAIGGGTYVHDIKNGVAFGCCEAGIDNHMHGADEFMDIEQILISCEIFAHGILNLCG